MRNNTFQMTNLFFIIFIYYFTTSTLSLGQKNEGLHVGFYNKSCPQAESIVREVMTNNSGIAASILRLYFHDCFVNGCDASILLDSTPSGEEIEKTSPANIGVRGFEIIDEAKAQLEKACPNTVSCADIISFAARDAAVISSLKPYDVPAGRRDGLKSLANTVFGNLPFPSSNVGQMNEIFAKKGMNKSDLVILLGVHSIGRAHCFLFENEIHNFNGTHQSNPRLNSRYASMLRSMCPPPKPGSESNKNDILPLNIVMDQKLSNQFYDHVLKGNVVIPADQSLLDDGFTRKMVHKYAMEPLNWANDFREALIKLGNVEVLTGEQGEIRENCRVINQSILNKFVIELQFHHL